MADPSKTERATPRRRQEARERGQVARSGEINSVLVLAGAVLAFKVGGEWIFDAAGGAAAFAFRNLNTPLTLENVDALALHFLGEFLKILAPLFAVVLVVGLLANYLQVGVLFTLKPLVPKFHNIHPMRGIQRIFSKRSLVEFAKSLLKVGLVGLIGYQVLKGSLPQLVPTMDMPPGEALRFLGGVTLKLLVWIVLSLLVLAVLDFLYQRWEYEQSLKMSRQEVRDELKQTEGDPLVRSRIRQLQREMARRRMFEAVPRADVVVTNPTHVAVALQYKSSMAAPVVLAKGERRVAERIREIAEKHRVPIVENQGLARALFKACPVGAAIPPDLYEAVAEVLAFVYRRGSRGAA